MPGNLIAALTAVDKATLAYHAGVFLIFGAESLRRGLSLAPFLVNVLAIAAVFAVRARRLRDHGPWARFFADFHPFFFFLPIYTQVGALNRLFVKVELDPWLQRADEWIFGGQPSVVLSRDFHPPWFWEYMHFAYASFYWMLPVVGLILAYRHPRDHFARYLEALCLAFYACNFLFLFLPALGPTSLPGASFDHPGGPFTALMAWLYRFEIPGGFFPSSHVALATVVLHYSLLLGRKRFVFWILGLSLIASTVYCGYHYAVDVLGGLALAYAVIAVAEMRAARRDPAQAEKETGSPTAELPVAGGRNNTPSAVLGRKGA